MPRMRRWTFRPLLDHLDDRCLLDGSGLTPAQIATAYGLTGLTVGNPAQPANGAGEKIAVIEVGDDPNIQAELAAFDQQFNLPAPASLTVLGQSGTAALPPVNTMRISLSCFGGGASRRKSMKNPYSPLDTSKSS